METVRRRFWCGRAGREVEVVFSIHGVPGLRMIDRALGCTAFHPCTAVACDQRCVDAGFRRAPSHFPLPIARRR